jgi:hypothetical protein
MLATVAAVPVAAAEDGVIHLFNGKDLTNFYTWLKDHGRNSDPKNVFTVKDGVLRISGESWGPLTTEKEYGDYHLVAEFRWGRRTWEPRATRARDSGILLHGQGPDGAFSKTWMASIECQMIEGGTGDFLVLSTSDQHYSLTVEAEPRPTTSGGKTFDQPYFKPGAAPKTLTRGRFNWYGRDPSWEDVKGFRGREDVEKPIGEWNTLECICDGDRITVVLNGKVVNKGTKCSHTRGKILIQSEGAEVFFRRIDLKPLKKASQ